jgi:hypothetical protein
MSNVNNLNGIPNFGHGDDAKDVVIPNDSETCALDDAVLELNANDVPTDKKKVHKSRIKSAAQKAFGGTY